MSLEQRVIHLEQLVENLLQANNCQVGPPGPRGADGLDGKDGKDGQDGVAGIAGRTPVKGIDYFDGTDGRDGIDGNDGRDGESQAAFTSTVFLRVTDGSNPARPVGGTYAYPFPIAGGWTDGPGPGSGQGVLFFSSRIFSTTGLPPQQEQWSVPKIAADSTTVDFEWSNVEVNPGTPTTHPDNWVNVADDNSIWMAMRTLQNGTWGDWQIIRAKGEKGADGNDGTPGRDGQKGDTTIYMFAKNGSFSSPPTLTTADRTNRNPTGWSESVPSYTDAEYIWKIAGVIDADNNLVGQWTLPIRDTGRIGLQGLPGADGRDGIDGTGKGVFKSTVFIRTNSTPSIPTGGSFADPFPPTGGWTDGIPNGEAKLWASTRIFTTDGSSPQQSDWTTPMAMTDTSTVDYAFSAVAVSPGNPTTIPGNWHEPETATASDIWGAMRTKTNGVWSDWAVYKIKGENGADGIDGADGINGTNGARGPFMVPMGAYNPEKIYRGTNERLEAVFYDGDWYVTRSDAGTIPVGTLPTNTTYFNVSDETFDFIATGLFLASIAYIDKLIARTVQTAIDGERTTIGTPVNVLQILDPTINWSSHASRKYYASGNIMVYDGFVAAYAFKEGTTNKTLTNEPAIIFFDDTTEHNPTLVLYGGYTGGQAPLPADPSYEEVKLALLSFIPWGTNSSQFGNMFGAETMGGANDTGSIIGTLDPDYWCGNVQHGYSYNLGFKTGVITAFRKRDYNGGSPRFIYRTAANDAASGIAQGIYLTDFSPQPAHDATYTPDPNNLTTNISVTIEGIGTGGIGLAGGISSGGRQRVNNPQTLGTPCTGPTVMLKSS